TRVSAPAAPAPQIPAFQVVATTPVTGLGFDRDKVPAMVQTLPAEDFSRVYSPNVTQTLEQRVPGVFISEVQGHALTSAFRIRRLGRLLRSRWRLAAIRHQEWRMGPLPRRPGAQRRWLALPIAIADRPLLRRSRLERHRRGGPSGRERRRQFLWRRRADARRT